jgi:hypothetical protein
MKGHRAREAARQAIVAQADARAGVAMVTLGEIFASYAQYLKIPEFTEGFEAHGRDNFRNPYDGDTPHDGDRRVKAEAWDRGVEAASRWQREKLKQAAIDLEFPRAMDTKE